MSYTVDTGGKFVAGIYDIGGQFASSVADIRPPMSTCTHRRSVLILENGVFGTRTAKTQYRKFETNIPGKGTARLPVPISTISDDWSAYSAAGKYEDRSWKYINRSKTHDCENWDRGRAIPFLGIHKWDYRCRAWCTLRGEYLYDFKNPEVHNALMGFSGAREKVIHETKTSKIL